MSGLTLYVAEFSCPQGPRRTLDGTFWHVQSRRMRTTMSLAVPLLLSLCLAACSADNAQPTVLAPSSPSPAVTSADTLAIREIDAPVLPPGADAQTADGAMAFVRHYFAVVDYAYATGDTAPLAAVSDPACRPCAGVKGMIDTTTSEGGSYASTTTQLIELTVPDGEPRGAVEVHVQYHADGAVRLDSGGAEVSRLETADGDRLRFVLVPAGLSWLIYDYSEMPA